MSDCKILTPEILATLSDDQIIEIRTQLETELKKRLTKRRSEAKRKIVELAQSHNIKLDELAGQEKIYQNPNNPWEKWNGKGRKPKWVKTALEEVKTLSDLEVT